MRHKTTSWALAATLAAGLASASQTVDRTLPADPGAVVEIDIISGSVDVTGWDRPEVRVTGTVGDDVEELVVSGGGSRIEIEIDFPDGRRGWRGRQDLDAYLKISVPAGSRLEIETVSAPIEVKQVSGRIEAESVSGSVRVSGRPASVDAETVSGAITVDGAATQVSAESVSGSVRLTGVAGRLDAETVSGSLVVRAEVLDRIDVESVSGSLEIEGALAPRAQVEISSHSGNVTLRLPASVSASFDVSTFSGSIRNEFGPAAERTDRWAPGKRLEFTAGAGDAEVSIETFSGSVHLVKK